MELFRNNQFDFLGRTRLSILPLLILLTAAPALPQNVATPRLAFEIASVKPSKSVDPTRGGRFFPGGRYSASGIPLRIVILTAYEIDPVRLTGGPDWLNSEGFDIDAKAEAGAIARGALDRVRLHRLHLMLQSLLEDRFQLTVHRETKKGPVYELAIAKGGFKLHALTSVDCEVLNPTVANPGCGNFTESSRNGVLVGPQVEMRDMAEMLPRLMDRPVVDKTGIRGYFDINLRWTIRTDSELEVTGGREPGPDRREAGPAQGLTIFAALDQQLGLKLEPKRGPIEIVVVDRVERPSGN
jgi:uncharacterized protein (TIGR03435 family)